MEQQYRRKAPRRHYNGQVGVLYKGLMTITTYSQLGEGGALIRSQGQLTALQEGEEMVITLFLPNIGGIVATAECVYVADSGKVGLQFHELEMKYKVRVREFVSRRKAVEAI